MALPAAVPARPTTSARPTVVSLPRTLALVGAGRAGTAVAAALARAGVRPVAHTAVAGRSAASRSRAAALLPGVPARHAVTAASTADLVVLAVPDDALGAVVAELAEADAVGPRHVVVHLSGAQGLAVLAPLAAAGATTLALHPAQTFSGTPDDLPRLAAAAVAVTAAEADLPLARALVDALGATPVDVPEEARAAYHAGLCHGANHLVTLVADTARVLGAAGLSDPATLLRPLLAAALERALSEGVAGLSGPVSRGDAETVHRHVAALQITAPDVVAPYAALAARTVALASAADRLTADDARRVTGALEQTS